MTKRGKEYDKNFLLTHKSVSIFWITETNARAKRIMTWEKHGIIKLDNGCGYPWLTVVHTDGFKVNL